MRIPDQILKCVGFVSRRNDPASYRATAFIVSVPVTGSQGWLHLVTAKHVAERIESGEACIAANALDGAPRWMHVSPDSPWFYHPDDPSVDVAVQPMAITNPEAYDFRSISTEDFATPSLIAANGIGVGDETVTVGLFSPYPGEVTRLEPIVRTGNVAMMPRGPISHSQFVDIDAYLVEGRSIGGLSGSPVFVRKTIETRMQMPTGDVICSYGLGQPFLLGLVHGHWDAPPDFMDPGKRVNMGIAIVVPSAKILEVLFSPALCRAREEAAARQHRPSKRR